MIKENLKKELNQRMDATLNSLDERLKGLRTSRASTHLLNPVQVEAYGNKMPLSQVATVSTADARTLTVQVWDKSMVKAVEKAIVDSNLGLTPQPDGQLIRITLPMLTEERRKELAVQARKYGEETKRSIRTVRQYGNDELKKFEKEKQITEDELHSLLKEVQNLTEDTNKKIDTKVVQKEKDIMTI